MEMLKEEHWLCLNCEEDDEEEPDNIEEIGQETQYKEVKTKETTLKILQLNIDSVMSKIEELKQLVKNIRTLIYS